MTDLTRSAAVGPASERGRTKVAARTGAIVMAFALTLGAAAAAQTPPASSPPPQPVVPQTPPLLRPPSPPPPPRARAVTTAAAARQTATFPAVRAPTRVGLPVDSARPAAAPAPVTPQADAVAECRDGTLIVQPAVASACASHGGSVATMPQRAAPPPAVSRVSVPPAAVAVAAPTTAAPPAGATARCKDGSYLSGPPSGSACAGNGGLAAAMPATRTAPLPPARTTTPARATQPARPRPTPKP